MFDIGIMADEKCSNCKWFEPDHFRYRRKTKEKIQIGVCQVYDKHKSENERCWKWKADKEVPSWQK